MEYTLRPLLTSNSIQSTFKYESHYPPIDSSTGVNIQLELPLKSIEDIKYDLLNAMARYEDAENRLYELANNWVMLMNDVNNHSMVETQFKQLQLIRKLSKSES